MKRCAKCGEDRNEDQFTVVQRNPDGLNTICKSCAYKTSKYQIAKFEQWLSLKKRAMAENEKLLFTQDQYYVFLKKHELEFKELAEIQELTPYVDRSDKSLPFNIENLKVFSKSRNKQAVIGKKANGDVLKFDSVREAAKHGLSRRKISSAAKDGAPYMDYTWEFC
jgi:hypothetical protein